MLTTDSIMNEDLAASKINDRSPSTRKLAIVVTSIICLIYITYRGLFTLNLATTYSTIASLMLYTAEIFGIISLYLFFLQVWEVKDPPLMPVLEGRTVDVFVPTYNEDPLLLRATLQACVAMDYPHKTYLCDDGGTEQRTRYPEPDDPDYEEKKKKADAARERQAALKAICEELGVIYCTRPKNEHAKAGNLNYAFDRTDGEFMIIFDADHVPEPNFITRLLGYFADENLAFVQTPHAFYNFNSFQAVYDPRKNKYWEEGQLFYQVIQPGRNRWNCPIFAGSAAMFRRKALKEVGYIATETITEDMHTGMRMNARGWKSLAIRDRLVAGQAAPDVTTFHTQRLRWGEGNISIMFYDNPLTMRGLSWPQRLCQFASMINWTGGVFKLLIYATPILMLFTGVPPVAQFTWLLLIMTLLYLVSVLWTVKYVLNGHGSIINSEIYTMMGFWTQIRATCRALFWRKFQSFVVTQKRGRQSKSIIPFIRPHIVLVALSIIALGWAWARPLTGISDDFYKPIIPTFWTVVNMLLALYVIRRALAPEDQRFSFRHQVQLPVAYEREDGTCGAGITIDLSEQGMSLVTYERLPDKGQVLLALQTPLEILECTAEIRHYQPWNPGHLNVTLPGFRYGLEFTNLTDQQRDAINRICIHYAVARLYNIYKPNSSPPWVKIKNSWFRLTRSRRHNERRDYRLPVVVSPINSEEQDGPVFAITENISRNSLAVLLSSPLKTDQLVTVFMPTPLGDIHGQGRVVRNKATIIGAHRYEYCVVEITDFQETSRSILNSLMLLPEGQKPNSVLNPMQQVGRIPIMKPLMNGFIRLIPIYALIALVFILIHRDLFFLRDVKNGRISVSSTEVNQRLLAIYTDTYKYAASGGYPSNDQLVLLIGALRQANYNDKIIDVTLLLAPRDPTNHQLQLAYAYALDHKASLYSDSGNQDVNPQEMWQTANNIFNRLIRSSKNGDTTTSLKEILLGAARNAVHAANDRNIETDQRRKDQWLNTAITYYNQLLRLIDSHHDSEVDLTSLRNEYAGVLAQARHFEELEQLYAQQPPDDDGKLLLAQIFAAREQFERAEEICYKLLDDLSEQLKEPERLDNKTFAKLETQRANVLALLVQSLAAQKDAIRSDRYYRELAKKSGKVPEIALRLAELDLQNNKFDEALSRLKPLVTSELTKGSNKLRPTQVYPPFIDAVAGIKEFPKEIVPAVKTIYDFYASNRSILDPIHLTRLAYVLNRAGLTKESTDLLADAYKSRPQDSKVRQQYIANLIDLKRYSDAARLLEQEEDPKIRRMLVGVYIKENNLEQAEKEAKNFLNEYPDDLEARRALAEVYALRGNLMSAIVELEKLLRQRPNDSEIQQRLGEVYLSVGDHQAALSKFQELLNVDFDRPKLWEGFINAAAESPRFTPKSIEMALRIAEALNTSEATPAVMQSRLAWVLYRLRRLPQSRELALKAFERSSSNPAERREIAGVLMALEQYEPALKLLLSIEPPTVADRLEIAKIYLMDRNKLDLAISMVDLVLSDQPNHVDANLLRAEALMFSNRYDEALQYYSRVRQLRPNDLTVDLRLAQVALVRKDYDRAIDYFEKLFSRYVPPPAPKLLGAEPLATQDRELEIWKGFIDAAASCSSKSITNNTASKLIALADRLEQTNKIDDPVYLGRMGAILRRINRSDRALYFLQRAHEIDPGSIYLRTMLRDNLYDLGRFDEAEQHNRVLLQARPSSRSRPN